jgi:hypothetical protein
MSNLRDWSGNVRPGRFRLLRSCFGGGRDILAWLISSTTRRFPPLWTVEDIGAAFVVTDSADHCSFVRNAFLSTKWVSKTAALNSAVQELSVRSGRYTRK